ncbi:L-idonate 5-dehydrogenase [Burkholderia ubonensis]|uniref:L-idonate 5-dehydrogenase n=1 Tax=Burkholderia ubonensis TaxID=101571 RepID=A0A103QNS0_9BURK|nr:L-idonate 5-dehydrogenase [Burkholderia ubonensis]AOJ61599.1 L-idonate 5-dehydrogenase [Burkholderia ubonensis]KVG52812.1 L-idonate 5-dehydrogenase [Burkholderia ubonensis]
MRMRCMCVVIHGPNDLRLEEQDPGEIGPGQVRVDVAMGGICGSDLHYFRHGGFGTVRLQQPMVLGHEVAGTVAAVAADVTSVQVGDRVAVNPSRPCGACRYCVEGLPNQCLDMRFYGSAMRMPHVQGAFRNALVCDARQCVKVADHVPLSLAALAEPFAVGLHAVSRAGPLIGRRVLVSGCGPIGTLAVAAARAHGAAEVVATDVVDEPLAIARALGADRTINAATDAAWVARHAADKGTFDVMLECSGNERALRDGLDVMRPRGVVVQLGLGGDVSLPQNVVVAKELSICGSFRFHSEFALAVQLINEGRVDLRPAVTGVFPMRDAGRAFELAGDRRRAMKVLIDFADDAA